MSERLQPRKLQTFSSIFSRCVASLCQIEPTVTEPNTVTEEIPPTPSVPPVSPPPTEQQRKFQLLCNIVGWDHKVITKEQVGQVAQTLGILGKAGYTEEHLKQFFEKVWSNDWRWMNHHSYPTLAQVRMEIGKLKMTIADVVPVRQSETVTESAPIPHFQRLQQRKGFYTQ